MPKATQVSQTDQSGPGRVPNGCPRTICWMNPAHIVAVMASLVSVSLVAGDLESGVAPHLPGLVETYEHLHAWPELSYQETETSGSPSRKPRVPADAYSERPASPSWV